ncbi:MAG: response regulator transcription factor [Pontimonas sp.]
MDHIDDEHKPRRRVLVFDPQPLLRELVVNALTQEGFDTLGADTPKTAWHALIEYDPDAVVLELNINSCESGASFSEAMLARSPGMGLVFLTDVLHPRIMDPERDDLPAGAAFLHKSSLTGSAQIISALDDVLRGRPDVPRHDRDYAAGWDELLGQQIDVLRLIAAGHSNSEIALRRGTQVRSVEALVGRTFDKLNIHLPSGEGNRRVLAARHYLLACPRQLERPLTHTT